MLKDIKTKISSYNQQVQPMPGLQSEAHIDAFAFQLVESQRKIERTERLAEKSPSRDRCSPGSNSFDPELGAIVCKFDGDLDEAIWLAFLSVHFGRHGTDGWLLCRQIYGAFGAEPYWTWAKISAELDEFNNWLLRVIPVRNAPMGRFGNHRKYESISSVNSGLFAVFASYISWINESGGHEALISAATDIGDHNPKRAFRYLYSDMHKVLRFGRLGRFDFLTLVSKLGLAPIEADAMYLSNATGPKKGARLLFYGSREIAISNEILENSASMLAEKLELGMQTMEDAICNWQKNPNHRVSFRG